MDEFDFDDQRLPVRRGPPTDDAVPVFDDTGHETTAAAGSFRTREAGLDPFEADEPASVTAVPAAFGPGTPAQTTAGLNAGVTNPVRPVRADSALPAGSTAAMTGNANVDDDPFQAILDQTVRPPASAVSGGAFQQREPGLTPGYDSNPTPRAVRTEASPTPPGADSALRRGQPTGVSDAVRTVVLHAGGAANNSGAMPTTVSISAMQHGRGYHHAGPGRISRQYAPQGHAPAVFDDFHDDDDAGALYPDEYPVPPRRAYGPVPDYMSGAVPDDSPPRSPFHQGRSIPVRATALGATPMHRLPVWGGGSPQSHGGGGHHSSPRVTAAEIAQLLGMSSTQLSDHAKKALEPSVKAALDLIKRMPQTNLLEWQAAVRCALTAVGGITGGDKYAEVASIALGMQPTGRVVNPDGTGTVREGVSKVVQFVEVDDAFVRSRSAALDTAALELLIVELRCEHVVAQVPGLAVLDEILRRLMASVLTPRLQRQIDGVPTFIGAVCEIAKGFGDCAGLRRDAEIVGLLGERPVVPAGVDEAEMVYSASFSEVGRAFVDNFARRGMCEQIKRYSVEQLGLCQAAKGLPEPVDDSSAARDMMLSLRLKAAELSSNKSLTVTDVARAVQAIEAKYSGLANKPVTFRRAPLPGAASVPAFVAEAPQPPAGDQRRGNGKHFQSEATRLRKLSAVGGSITQVPVQNRAPAYDRHDGQPQPQQRRGGGDVRQYEQRPNQQRAREYPATAVQPARQSPTRPAPTQQGSDYQPGVCFTFRDKGVCNKPNCPYSHEAVMTHQLPRGGGRPSNRSNTGRTDGGDRGERRARFTGFASAVNQTECVPTVQPFAAVVDAVQRRDDVGLVEQRNAALFSDAVELLNEEQVLSAQQKGPVAPVQIDAPIPAYVADVPTVIRIAIDSAAADIIVPEAEMGTRLGVSRQKFQGISGPPVNAQGRYGFDLSVLGADTGTGAPVLQLDGHLLSEMKRGLILLGAVRLSEAGCEVHIGAAGNPSYMLLPAHPVTGHQPRIECGFVDGVLQITDSNVVIAPSKKGAPRNQPWYNGPAGAFAATVASMGVSRPPARQNAQPIPVLRMFMALQTSEKRKPNSKQRRQRRAAEARTAAACLQELPAPEEAPCIVCDGITHPLAGRIQCVGRVKDGIVLTCSNVKHRYCGQVGSQTCDGSYVCVDCVTATVRDNQVLRAQCIAVLGAPGVPEPALPAAGSAPMTSSSVSEADLSDSGHACDALGSRMSDKSDDQSVPDDLDCPSPVDLRCAPPAGATMSHAGAAETSETFLRAEAHLGGALGLESAVAAEMSDGSLPGLASTSEDSDSDAERGSAAPSPIYMAVGSPAAPGQFRAPRPQAPQRRGNPLEHTIMHQGLLDPKLWEQCDAIVCFASCDGAPGQGITSVIRSELPYSVVRGPPRNGADLFQPPGTMQVRYPRHHDHDRTDLALPAVITVYANIRAGSARSDRQLGYHDDARARLECFDGALEAITHHVPRLARVAIDSKFDGTLDDEGVHNYMCSLRTAVAAHPAITFILVVTPSAAQSRVHASTDRRDRSPDRQHRQDGRDRTPPPPMHSSRRSQSSTSRGNTASGAGALLPYVACLKDVPRALQLPARPGSDPREAGKHYLRNYVARWADYQRSDGHCGAGWALFDFGARSFGGADAVLVSPYAHYIACDLFAYNDARVIQMLDRHNQNGVRAVYMQGVRGRVPTIDAIATVMQNTWGLPIQALRVLMASPNCGTISSASTRGRYPPLARDPTNDFAPISHRAREDDQTRMGITRLVENLYRLRLRTSDSPLFTALLEQPRSGCASGLRDIRAALEFGAWSENHVDHCQFSRVLQSQKPTNIYSFGPFSPVNAVCRAATPCEWLRPDGRHICSIVSENDPTQIRIPDHDERRSKLPTEEVQCLVSLALAAQDCLAGHAPLFCEPVRSVFQPQVPQHVVPMPSGDQNPPRPVLTARLAGRPVPLSRYALDPQQLHMACGHVDPQLILDSIPSWIDFKLKAKQGILTAGSIKLADLQIEGTCHSCARGRTDASSSRHTAHQRKAKKADRRRNAQQRAQSAPATSTASPVRRSERVRGGAVA